MTTTEDGMTAPDDDLRDVLQDWLEEHTEDEVGLIRVSFIRRVLEGHR